MRLPVLGGLLAFAAGSALAFEVPRLSTNSSGTPNYASFFYGKGDANLSLSISTFSDTGDLYFRFAAPKAYDWAAFGIGPDMRDALMFVMYPCKHPRAGFLPSGNDVTLSTRFATGHSEPVYKEIDAGSVTLGNDPNVDITMNYQVAGYCKNCTRYMLVPFDLESDKMQFIFAVGPFSGDKSSRWSDEPDAPLRRHTLYGHFTMDLKKATSPTDELHVLPPLKMTSDGASLAERVDEMGMHEWGSVVHAIFMCMAFGILLPIDALLVYVFGKQRLHYWMQGFFGLMFFISFIVGCYISTLYNRSKTYSSPHQILGILMLVLLIVWTGLGVLNSRYAVQIGDDKTLPPPKWLHLAHKLSFVLLLIIGITNVCLGFNFALSPGYNRLWVPMILGVIVLITIFWGMKRCWSGISKDFKGEHREEELWVENGNGHQSTHGLGPIQTHQSYEMQNVGREQGVNYQTVQFPKTY